MNNKCPICNNISKDYGIKSNYFISRCSRCSHIFVDPIPSFEMLKNGYSNEDTSFVTNDSDTFVHLDNGNTLDNRLSDYLQLLFTNKKNDGRHLDIGAGSGYLMRMARKSGWDTIGIEPGPWGKLAAAKYDLNIKSIMLENISSEVEIAQKSYDLITLIDVLEHLGDPLATISTLQNYLSFRGKIVAQFPYSSSFASVIRRTNWPLMLPPGHIHYFSRDSIKLLAKKSVLTITRSFTQCHTPILPLSRYKIIECASRPIDKFIDLIKYGDLITVVFER